MSTGKEQSGPWLAMVLCGLLAITALVLSVLSDSQWKVPLLILVPLCFIAAAVTIYYMRGEIRDLRRQVARLQGLADETTPGTTPKSAYSVDEDNQRRLHISRLQLWLLFVPGLALATLAGNDPVVLRAADDVAVHSPTLEARLNQLRISRVETARKTRDAVRAAYEADTVTLDLVLDSADNVLTAELAVAKAPQQWVAAHKDQVVFLRRLEQKIFALYKVGARGGECEKLGQARYRRETAEISLAETCLAEQLSYPAFDADLELPEQAGFDP